MLRVQVADTAERLDTMEVLVLQSVITTRSQLLQTLIRATCRRRSSSCALNQNSEMNEKDQVEP